MAVAPGTQLEFQIQVAAADTFEAIAGAQVALQRFDAAIGDFRPVAPAVADSQGRVTIRQAAPTIPGHYRYRSAWPGNATYRADTSPEVRVDVAPA